MADCVGPALGDVRTKFLAAMGVQLAYPPALLCRRHDGLTSGGRLHRVYYTPQYHQGLDHCSQPPVVEEHPARFDVCLKREGHVSVFVGAGYSRRCLIQVGH